MSEKQADKATMFASLRASLSRSVRLIVPDKEIEDVVQETFLRFCQASDEQEIRSPEAFMFRTARNLALDHVKSAEYRLTETLEDYSDFLAPGLGDAEGGPPEQVASQRELSMFSEAVMSLPAKARQAFVLRRVYGYSQREIANLMSISEKTVEKHISLGVRRTTEHLVEAGYFENRKPSRSRALHLVADSGGRRKQ